MDTSTRRSPGCQSCRRAKKGCDLARPKCGRCVRLNQACGDYPHQSSPMLISWPCLELSADPSCAQESALLTPPDSIVSSGSSLDDNEAEDLSFFSDDWSFLFTNYAGHELIRSLIAACNLMAHKDHADNPTKEHAAAIQLYVQALGTARAALFDKTRSQEDATLVAAMLLAILERLNRSSGETSAGWMVHEDGISSLLENRSITQAKTKLGRTVLRLARDMVIDAAFCRDIGAPRYIISYTQAIKHDPQQSIYDQLAILEARATHLWSSYRANDLGTNLHTDNLTFRRDLQLWERSAALSVDFQKFYGPSFGVDNQPQLGARQMMQQHCPRVRMDTCRVVTSRIEKATCQRQMQSSDRLSDRAQQRFEDSMLEITDTLCASAASALQIISGAKFLDMPTTSALLLTRPLYILAVALGDELSDQTKTEGHESRRHRKVQSMLKSQVTFSMEILQHLQNKFGDFYAREILRSLRSTNSQFSNSRG